MATVKVNTFQARDLAKDVREQWKEWAKVITDPGRFDKTGLWVMADDMRRASLVAIDSGNHAWYVLDKIPDLYFSSIWRASALVEGKREMWSLERRNRMDEEDVDDYDALLGQFKMIRKSPVLVIDQLQRAGFQKSFWDSHLWGIIRERILDGKPTIVASDTPPAPLFGDDWDRFFYGIPVGPEHWNYAGR